MTVLETMVNENVQDAQALANKSIQLEKRIDTLDGEIREMEALLKEKRDQRKQLANECLDITGKLMGINA